MAYVWLVWMVACKPDETFGGTPVSPWDEPSSTIVVTHTDGGDPVTEPPDEWPFVCVDAPQVAEEILAQRCGECHTTGELAYGGFGVAGDPEALVTEGWVVPGEPGASIVWEVVSRNEMPPSSPLTAEESGWLYSWIACGAESWDAPPPFLGPELELRAARDDARTQPDPTRVRYLSLVPLYNAGVAPERILTYGTALTKLLFSLTTATNPPAPVALDLEDVVFDDGTSLSVRDALGSSLLFRIDIADLGWDAVEAWEGLVAAYPFAVGHTETVPDAVELALATGSRVPIVNADWFAANASRPPLYYDVLDVPETRDAFLTEFGAAGVLADFDLDRVACGGLDGGTSPVATFGRVLCRHPGSDGYCWETFDFGSEDLFSRPIAFVDGNHGGEVMCSLPSGQQVYGVFDAEQNRLDMAPIDLLSDYDPYSGGAIEAGLSCMRCHEIGVMSAVDQVRDAVTANPEIDPAVLDQVLAWFPEAGALEELQGGDRATFEASLAGIGVTVGEEPIAALAAAYEADVDLVRAAADLGIASWDLGQALASNPALDDLYESFDEEGGVMSRDLFEVLARDTICGLQLGDDCEATFCGASAVPCLAGSACDAEGRCIPAE